MKIEYLSTDKAPEAFGPFSQGTVCRDMLFTSGAMPLDPRNGNLVSGGIREQTRQTLENLKALLDEGGSSLDKVLSVTVYITDMDDFAEMNAVYAEYFKGECPARATVGVSSLAKEALVEMQAIALCSPPL